LKAEIGIIGGSGIYSLDSVEEREKRVIDTPYGESPEIILGELEGRDVAFMPRHGSGHSTPPHKINSGRTSGVSRNWGLSVFSPSLPWVPSIGILNRVISLSSISSWTSPRAGP